MDQLERRGTIDEDQENDDANSAFNDSFCTDSSSDDSLLGGGSSDEDLTEEDKLL